MSTSVQTNGNLGTRSAEPRPAHVLPFTPMTHMEHLLKVANSVTQDANKAWAEVWGELKSCVGANGMVLPQAAQGFVPTCGWPEFLEKFWMIKYYLDSIARICRKDRGVATIARQPFDEETR